VTTPSDPLPADLAAAHAMILAQRELLTLARSEVTVGQLEIERLKLMLAKASDGGLGLLVRLPIPGKQVGDFIGEVIWQPGQHVSKPGLGIDVVHLAGFDQGIA